MTHYFSRRAFLRSISAVACGAMMNRAFYADENKQPSPNFVVIVTDDQSWVGSSVLMAPGDRRTRGDYYQTPHIERLAMMGMRFTQGYSPAPFCCPTRRSLLIGQTPARHIYQKDQERIEQKEREVEREALMCLKPFQIGRTVWIEFLPFKRTACSQVVWLLQC